MASRGVEQQTSPLRWVVTAPPRSGTTWIARWLTNNGYPTSHERCLLTLDENEPTRLHFRRCIFPGESSYLAAPFCAELRAAGTTVIYLRRPIDDVVASMLRLRWDLTQDTHFGLAVRTFAPGCLAEEQFSEAYYRRFAEDWRDLISADLEWDLYSVGEAELAAMQERFG